MCIRDSGETGCKCIHQEPEPRILFQAFPVQHYWWDNNDLSKIMRTRLEGKLSLDRWGTQLRAGVEDVYKRQM